MNEFEKYLREHKAKMDIQQVSPDIWQGIEQEFSPKEKMVRFKYLKYVALAAACFAGFIGYQLSPSPTGLEIPAALYVEFGFDDVNVLENLEKKLELIQKTPVSTNYKSDLQMLLDQVVYLDQTYQPNIDYLEKMAYEEPIAKEVLQYYQAKSKLLDKIISEIQKINDYEKEYKINSEKALLQL